MNRLIKGLLLISIIFVIKVHSSEDDFLKEFYMKFCAETDIKILEKLEKCEEKNPPEIKAIESSCYDKIRSEQGKTGKPSLQEYQEIDCNPTSAQKFEKCMNETLTNDKLTELEKQYPANKLDQIAKEIMYCDCDVYRIKHNKN